MRMPGLGALKLSRGPEFRRIIRAWQVEVEKHWHEPALLLAIASQTWAWTAFPRSYHWKMPGRRTLLSLSRTQVQLAYFCCYRSSSPDQPQNVHKGSSLLDAVYL